MDPEHLLKFIGYFSDYRSALSRMPLLFFGQPLSKQLYIVSYPTCARGIIVDGAKIK